MMKITFVYHSCFTVEMDDIVLVFDYFRGKLPSFEPEKRIYMFVSHSHFDHYTRKIYKLINDYPNITFILPREMYMDEAYMEKKKISCEVKEHIFYVESHEEYEIGDVKVRTLKSTDEGVAYIINVQGKCIYHAGDLNWWAWKKDEENVEMEQAFKTEIDSLGKDVHVDVAFLPLDMRLQGGYYKGFDYVMQKWDVERAFPMHCWGHLEAIENFKDMPLAKVYKNKVVDIENDGMSWELPI